MILYFLLIQRRYTSIEGSERKLMETKRLQLQISSFILALAFLVIILVGNRIFAGGGQYFTAESNLTSQKAKVLDIIDRDYRGEGLILFSGEVLNGDKKGERIQIVQFTDSYLGEQLRHVEKGDTVYLGDATNYDVGAAWFLYEFERFSGMAWLGLVFAVLLLIFGRKKGLATLVSLSFTLMTIFLVFIPAILAGYNIYFSSLLLCIFITVMCLLIVQGPTAKCLAAAMGSMGGLFVISLITITMSSLLKITGLISEDSLFLIQMNLDKPLDLKAIVFASVTIGAMGAVLDIAVDIVAALSELYHHRPNISFKETLKSGIIIGQDIVGSMANTLILAYIGSSLSMVLLVLVNTGGISEVLNSELITVEILQALAGSIGILFTIPLSALSFCFLKHRPSLQFPESTG